MFLYRYKRPVKLGSWLLWALLVAGCASQQEKTPSTDSAVPAPHSDQQTQQTLIGVGAYRATVITGDYSHYPALNQFVEQMVSKYGFNREYLLGLFSQAKRKQWTLDYLGKSDHSLGGKPVKGGWTHYKAQFLDAKHINAGVVFWQKHKEALQRASQQYGVPAEYILGIMAVETSFGANVGSHRIIDALTTLGFDYARRGEYFRSELENFLVMTAQEGVDPGKPVGSFAGAMGLGQFMPSSFLQWAVDFDNDGRRDLWNSEDAIGSVANYFAKHGWQAGQPVVTAVRTTHVGVENLQVGIETRYSLDDLRAAGVEPAGQCQCTPPLELLLLRHQNNDEYLLGHANFYTITRYNHSTHYAMAVHELAQAIKAAYKG